MGVLSTPTAENVRLDVILNSRMGLSLAGSGASSAIVHVTGNTLHIIDDEYDMEDDDDDTIDLSEGLVDVNMLLNSNGIVFGAGEQEDEDEEQDSESDEDDDVVENQEKETNRPSGKPSQKRKRDQNCSDENASEDYNKKLVVKQKSPGLPILTHKSGLKYQDIIIGAGKAVQKGHNVAIQYVLRLENGKVIDRADRKRPFKFRLGIGECVKGFDIGVMGMREGGERHLIVPPQLGYASHPPPGIPKNSTLYFDVGVIKAF